MELPGVIESANFQSDNIYLRGYEVTEEMPIAHKTLVEINELAKDAPMKELFKLSSRAGTTPVVSFTGSGVNGMGNANFRTAYPSETLEVFQEKTDLAFSWNSPQGVAIVKTYVFHPDSYEVDLEVKVRNVSPDPIQDSLTVTLRNNVAQAKNSRYTFQGPAALIDGELEEIGLDDIEDDGNQTGVLSWIAFEDQYFASGLIPENPEKGPRSRSAICWFASRATIFFARWCKARRISAPPPAPTTSTVSGCLTW